MRISDYDVVVVGGGVSGTVAALASARTGARTLVLERYGFLGGTLTNSGVGPMMTFHAGDKQVVKGIAQDIVDELIANNGSPGHLTDTIGFASSVTPFDAETLKYVLQEMAIDAGVDMLFHCYFASSKVSNGRISEIQVHTKSGPVTIIGDVFIDATGDADLAANAGVEYLLGRESDNLCQPVTMTAKISNVDIEAIKKYIQDNPEQFNHNDLDTIDITPRLSISGFFDQVKAGKDKGEIGFERDIVLCFETNNPQEVTLNMTRIQRIDSTDFKDLSKAEIEGRRQVQQAIAFLRKNIPGFSDCVLLQTGPHIGIRESRKIKGLYTLTADDLVNQTMFDDTIALGGYPIDIHQPDGDGIEAVHLQHGGIYSIPYRTMITDKLDNLVVTGRAISSSHHANAAIRVTPIAMAVGHAAGVSAAITAQQELAVQDIDIKRLQTTLIEQGACLKI